MTPKELADKIIQELDCDSCQGNVRTYKESMDKIESLLASALAEEAFKHDAERAGWETSLKLKLDIAKAQAYEDAAKIAENFEYRATPLSGNPGRLAAEIREKAKTL